jgi:hypothetical protein
MNNLMRMTASKMRLRVAMLTLATLVATISAASQNLKPGFNIFSPQQDYEIGRQSALAANRQMRTYTDARITRIGRRLAAVAPGARFPYEFRVVIEGRLTRRAPKTRSRRCSHTKSLTFH